MVRTTTIKPNGEAAASEARSPIKEPASPAVAPAAPETPAPSASAQASRTDTAAKLTALLDGVSRADLVELNQDIEEQEARLAGLRSLKKLIQLRLGVLDRNGSHKKKHDGPVTGNGKPPGRSGPPASPETLTRRRNAAVFLHRNGPAGMPEVQRAIKADSAQVRHALNYPWFEQLPSGNWSLTTPGLTEAISPDED